MRIRNKVIYGLLMLFTTSRVFADTTPEFDGIYFQTKSNKFIEVEDGYQPNVYMSYIKRIDSKRTCVNNVKTIKIKLSQVKYLVLKNQRWSAEYFEKKIIGNYKDELCESYDKETLKIRTKSKGDTEFYKLQGIKKGDIYQFIVSPNRYYIEFI